MEHLAPTDSTQFIFQILDNTIVNGVRDEEDNVAAVVKNMVQGDIKTALQIFIMLTSVASASEIDRKSIINDVN